ncbi:MAG: NAD-dependent epimerase/dehydratase [Herminiimonas sp.]|nr:NAD-dependent epimerase/dehydratase [Herminiimonas sp.]
MTDSALQNRIGVIGASSLVGNCLLPLLKEAGAQVTAFSRRTVGDIGDGAEWRQLPRSTLPFVKAAAMGTGVCLPLWICVAPIWVLPEYFWMLDALGARRIVVLSSTSLFTKNDSSDRRERATSLRLAEGEERFLEWVKRRELEWVILRPTLIYGLGRDKNIAEIARFIRRFKFFPLIGNGRGLRQPIHAADVAAACLAALQSPRATNRMYSVSGGETLTYREMVVRIFVALGHRPRLLTVPLWVFSLAVIVMRRLPGYADWSVAMAERMNRDLVFDHSEAAGDIGFKPRAFVLSAVDGMNRSR